MTILLYLILIGGLLIFMSQTSYATVIAKVDMSTAERRVHCVHHAVHAICGILATLLALAILMGSSQAMVNILCIIASVILAIDAVSFVILNRALHFSTRRDAIMRKCKGEKVFGPEHDGEVSVYRTLKEITNKNLLRDGLHLVLFAILFILSLQ